MLSAEQVVPSMAVGMFLIDNSRLQAASPGLAERASKNLADRIGLGAFVEWNKEVAGIESSDGWLKVGDKYLPTSVNGFRVVVRELSVWLVLRRRPGGGAGPAACGPTGEAVVTALAGAVGPGARVHVHLPSACAGDELPVRATVAPKAGESRARLQARLSEAAACDAVKASLASGDMFVVVGCQIGRPSGFPERPAQRPDDRAVGPISLRGYASRLGGTGAVGNMEMVVKRLSLQHLSAAGLRDLRASIAELVAQAVRTDPASIQDGDGKPRDVSLALQGSSEAAAPFAVVNCHFALPFGRTVAGAAAELASEATRRGLAEALGALPAVRRGVAGDALGAADIQVGVAQSSDDMFFSRDTNFNNRMDREEFVHAAQVEMKPPLPRQQAESVFAALDVNHDSQLTDDEFFASSFVKQRRV